MNVNITKNRMYYASVAESSLCDCAYCRNYRSQIRSSYPQVASYLESLGIDIEKPYETSPLDPDDTGMLEYCCCQYVVFGSCEPEYRHKIHDVTFRIATSYPRTNIHEEHFVLEFFPIKLRFL